MIGLLAGLGAMCALLCLLLAAFLLASKGRLAHANRYLAGFLALTAVDLVGLVGLLLPGDMQVWIAYRAPLSFLQMPLFYGYIVMLCRPAGRISWHAAGAGVLVALTLVDMVFRTGQLPAWAMLVLHVQFYVYLGLSAWTAFRFGEQLKTRRSEPQTAQLRWMWAVIGTSFFAHSLVVLRTLSVFGGWPLSFGGLQLITAFIALAILCAMTLTALLRPALFKPLAREETLRSEPSLSEADTAALALRLESFMAEGRPYLEPALTLKAMARRLSVGERDLSGVLNHLVGLHFFDFVNRWRIRHAQTLIVQDRERTRTLLDIAYASGFNSKSSFNTAFKKHAGLTPSAFRASQDPG